MPGPAPDLSLCDLRKDAVDNLKLVKQLCIRCFRENAPELLDLESDTRLSPLGLWAISLRPASPKGSLSGWKCYNDQRNPSGR
jgi:hypothetical protein